MPANKIALGMGLYGRAFKLVSASNHDIGSEADGVPVKGPYTKEAGFLAYYEICSDKSLTTVEESSAGASYAYADDVWIGYDTPNSLQSKVDLIKQEGKHFT